MSQQRLDRMVVLLLSSFLVSFLTFLYCLNRR